MGMAIAIVLSYVYSLPGDVIVPILMYHKVDTLPYTPMWVGTTDFDTQLKLLKAFGYTSVSLYDFFQYKFNGVPLPAKPVILTFDDGYQNTYTQAYPIMKRYDFKATIFIITNYTANTNAERHINLEFDHTPEETLYPCSLLIWPEIEELFADGMSIQSHSKSHSWFDTLSPSEMEAEAQDSKAIIENILHTSVNFYSYPYGGFDSTYKEIVRGAGYLGAVSTMDGAEHTETADMYALKRISIWRFHTINKFLDLIDSTLGAGNIEFYVKDQQSSITANGYVRIYSDNKEVVWESITGDTGEPAFIENLPVGKRNFEVFNYETEDDGREYWGYGTTDSIQKDTTISYTYTREAPFVSNITIMNTNGDNAVPNSYNLYEFYVGDTVLFEIKVRNSLSVLCSCLVLLCIDNNKTIPWDSEQIYSFPLFPGEAACTLKFVIPITTQNRILCHHRERVYTYINNAYLQTDFNDWDGLDFPILILAREERAIPITTTILFQNYPNPFTEFTQFQYFLLYDSYVKICLYDIIGRGLFTLVDGVKVSGYHIVKLDAKELTSRIYYYTIKTDTYRNTRKMLVK